MAHELIDAVKKHCVSHGTFTLASGQVSDTYVDLSKLLYTSDGIALVIDDILYRVQDAIWSEADSIGGPALGACPLVTGLLMVKHLRRGFVVRPNQTDHGKPGIIEGLVEKGDNVILVEDVVTTGTSLQRTIDVVEALGCRILTIVAVLDRGQSFKTYHPFVSLMTLDDLV